MNFSLYLQDCSEARSHQLARFSASSYSSTSHSPLQKLQIYFMDQNIQQLKELIQVIEECEKTEEVIEWMMQICSPNDESQLIETLIKSFMKNLEGNVQYANQILRTLRKLNEWIPELVLPQMKESSNFPSAIYQYLTKIDLKDMDGDGFVLLTKIFDAANFQHVTNDKFIKLLFDSFERIIDEEIFRAVVYILVVISYHQPNLKENLVIKIGLKHPNIRFFAESLVHLINKVSQEQKLKEELKFVEDILQVDPEFFYDNDFRVLFEIMSRMIEDSYDAERVLYLKTTLAICQIRNFKKIVSQSRRNDLVEILFQVMNEDSLCSGFAQEVLNQLQE